MTAEKEDEDLNAAAREFVKHLEAGDFDNCLSKKLTELSLPMLEEVVRCLQRKLAT